MQDKAKQEWLNDNQQKKETVGEKVAWCVIYAIGLIVVTAIANAQWG
jgi:hypothetical protein